MAIVGRAAAGLAHDLAGFTTAILGFSEMLAEDFAATGVASPELDEIRSAAERANEMIARMLRLARPEPKAPSGTPPETSCDPVAAVTSLRGMVRSLVGSEVEVSFDSVSSLGRVAVSEADLDRLLINLVNNARRAMKGRGNLRVTLSAAVSRPDASLLLLRSDWKTRNRSSLPGLLPKQTGDAILAVGDSAISHFPPPRPGRYVAIAVGDDGCGMTREMREQIFEPFLSASPADRSAEGFGLGLANVREILARCGGGLRVWSVPDLGTTFCLLLPLSPRIGERAGVSPRRPERAARACGPFAAF